MDVNRHQLGRQQLVTPMRGDAFARTSAGMWPNRFLRATNWCVWSLCCYIAYFPGLTHETYAEFLRLLFVLPKLPNNLKKPERSTAP